MYTSKPVNVPSLYNKSKQEKQKMATKEFAASSAALQFQGPLSIKSNEVITAAAFVAPSTAPASAAIIVSGNAATPTVNLTMAQTAPLLPAASLPVLRGYATTDGSAAPAQANSIMVARPSVISAPINVPAGSAGVALLGGGGGFTTAAIPTLTAASTVQFWLVGATAAACTAGITVPTCTVTLPAQTLVFAGGTAGASYAYQVQYA